MKTTREFADAYRSLGWVVLPGKIGTKYPSIPWKEYQSRFPTQEEHDSWFANHTGNICLITGALSNVIVVDLDSYKKTYTEVDISSPVAVATPSGGTHLYFAYNERYGRNKVDAEAAVDVRGEGGLVVLPPSIFNGKTYSWVNEKADFHRLPEFTGDGLPQKVVVDTPFVFADNLQVEAGGRNAALFKVACNLIRTYKKDMKTAYYFTRLAGRDYKPSLSEHEINTVFKSAYKNVLSTPESQDYTIAAVKPQVPEKKVITGTMAVSQADVIQSMIDITPPIGLPAIDRQVTFIPGELYLISAETHVGKTLFSLQLASSMAHNTSKKVLYISLENGPRIVYTAATFCGGVLPESLFWYFPTEIITFKEIEEALHEDEFDCVFIDHLHFTRMEGAKSMGETINEMVLSLQMIARRRNIPIIAICHLRKSSVSRDGNMPTLADLKDTSALAQIPSVVMLIYRPKSESEKDSYLSKSGLIIIAKNRFGSTGSIPFVLRNNVFDFSMSPAEIAASGGVDATLDVLVGDQNAVLYEKLKKKQEVTNLPFEK